MELLTILGLPALTQQQFTNFIQQPLPEGSTTGSSKAGQTSGALGMGQRASTGLTTFNQFWSYTMPLFGTSLYALVYMPI